MADTMDFKTGRHGGVMRRYSYRVLAAEISATTRFADSVMQVEPLPHDDGLLLEMIDCSEKKTVDAAERVPHGDDNASSRNVVLLNGNLNASNDIQDLLSRLHDRLSMHDRLFAVLYNPYARLLFMLATWIGLRRGDVPKTFVTETDLRSLLKVSGFEIVRLRPAIYVPVWIPLLSSLLNAVLPAIPLINRLSLTWIVALRAVKRETTSPSLSIVIPARNERGNLESALLRMPQFATQDVEIIFVEGNSTDGTWEEIQRLLSFYEGRWNLKALQQPGRGKNDAVRLGFSVATGELLTILDADLTMPPELLPRFYDAWRHGHAGFINGNRLVYPMQQAAMRRLNLFGNRFFAKALSYVLGNRIGDSLCGTKLLARRDYDRLIQWRQQFGDFDPFGDFELLFAASELALGIVDIPIRYRDRTYGSTNISRFRDGWLLLKMTIYGFVRLRLGRLR
ncbi:MAG: glycosyltransferase family 2 protein [Pirellulaceae bacterium]